MHHVAHRGGESQKGSGVSCHGHTGHLQLVTRKALAARHWGSSIYTLHQKVKFVADGKIIIVLGDSIRPHSDTPMLEVGSETENVFLTIFSLEEAVTIQALMAE